MTRSLSPDGLTIVANDETHEVIDRIDIATGKITWQYGHYNRAGSGAGFLHTPDDAYPLANGDIASPDIENCRVIENQPDKQIVHQWGTTRDCVVGAPATYGRPNGRPRPFRMEGSSSRRSPARAWCGSRRTATSSSTSTSPSTTRPTPS